MSDSEMSPASKTSDVERVVMCNVREHNEEMDVALVIAYGTDRLVVKARNEGGHNCTEVDLLDLLKWVSENSPDVYMQFVTNAMMRDYT